MKVEKLWGGRFEELPPREVVDFLSGRDVKGVPPSDERLFSFDLWGNRAHVLMLYRQGILSKQDVKKILRGLKELENLHQKGEFKLNPSLEDVHSNIENFLIKRLGIEYGGKVHTGRSRNDQIALDMRLYLRDQTLEFVEGLIGVIKSLLQRAGEHRLTVMPGYTHHQLAMATTFGHLLLSFAESLVRDIQRFMQWVTLFNKNPLGSAAGYGTSLPLNRQMTSKLLAFDGPTENVTDAITQRWEPEAELGYAITMMMNHLSTMAQTLILLSTREFNMVRLDDQHCSGSSIMPQKRNPCSLEVIKAKASFAQGVTMSLLSTGKALFMGYNRDTQWTKYSIMDLVEETKPALFVMAEVIRLLRVDKTQMLKQAEKEFAGATPLMEWMIVSFGLPLRKAKMVVEKAIKYSEKEGMEQVSYQSLKRALKEMDIELPLVEQEIKKVQRPERVLSKQLSFGSPSQKRTMENVVTLMKKIDLVQNWVMAKRKGIEKAKTSMVEMEKDLEG